MSEFTTLYNKKIFDDLKHLAFVSHKVTHLEDQSTERTIVYRFVNSKGEMDRVCFSLENTDFVKKYVSFLIKHDLFKAD